ncbi:MAG: 30S ribosomal protein S18 [Anaerolineaceae bacterium]|nr:30S ribosomal protein S18 [Anaerolineaceae bacterium]
MSDTYQNDSKRSYGGGRRYVSRPKICQFCADKNIVINYKEVDMLRRFITEDGNIRPRRQTGTCAKHQRTLASAIKRSRQIALLPFTGESLNDALRHQ